MNGGSGMPPDRVPTLTEVVAWPAEAVPGEVLAQPGEAAAEPAMVAVPEPAPAVDPTPARAALPAITEAQLTQHILTDVQRQIDLMLEYRLREALAPVLARATDNLVRESRSELASTLRDVVARAVAQEMSRHRSR